MVLKGAESQRPLLFLAAEDRQQLIARRKGL